VARGNGHDKAPAPPGETQADERVGPDEESAPHAAEAEGEPKGLTPATEATSAVRVSREQFEAVCRERDELNDQLLRKRAEFSNFRKRVERERQQAGTDAVAAFLAGLLPTLDHLELALEQGGNEAALREGVELTRRDFLAYLEAQGVEIFDPKGQRFDPGKHQALSHEVVPGFEEGTIVEVYRKGCSLDGRLVRPALVRVAKAEPSEDGDREEDADREKVH
jgi:molecular chaperone GrpE